MTGIRKHSQALLHPSEIVTLGLLSALKGASNRAFYRWVKRDWVHLFPHLPDRTRLFYLFKTHQDWTNRFLAELSLLGVIEITALNCSTQRCESYTTIILRYD